jgi:insulysin
MPVFSSAGRRLGSHSLKAILLAAAISCSSLYGIPPSEKHPLDKSESRTLQLENGLRVALVSDPELNLAAASMAVDVGSYANPEDAQGLTHFLEHMLFLGTGKYPDVAEYSAYLRQNDGYRNGYTATDHTNFHFEVHPAAFEGALDRFAQFFIAPLFNPEFIERELKAVDSEFQKDRENDNWRSGHLFNMAVREGHPQRQFSTGNLDTLGNVTREVLLDFYNRHYTAGQMALALVSPAGLDTMEAWVRQYFHAVRGSSRERLRYPADPLPRREALRILEIQSQEARRSLFLSFPAPSIDNDWDAKTSNLVRHIMNDQAEGSLHAHLTEAGLANGLSGSIWAPTRDYAWLNIAVDLTPAGLENYDQVIQSVLGYFKAIRKEPFPAHIHKELATMARLEEKYSARGEGSRRAFQLANRVLKLPLAYAERSPYLFLREDPEFYFTLLDAVRPDNMLVRLLHRNAGTDQVDPLYGTHYSYGQITGRRYEALANAPTHPDFTLPAANPFVPQTVDIVRERPVKLIDRPDLTLFFGQDTAFQRPKVAMHFRFRPVWDSLSVRDSALLDLLQACFIESVARTGYAARTAGADFELTTAFDQVSLTISGYSDSVGSLSRQLITRLGGFQLSGAQFDRIKDRQLREWNNTKLGNPSRFIRLYHRKVMEEGAFLPWEKAAAASNLTLDDVVAFRNRLFARGRLETLVYGNITAEGAIECAEAAVGLLAFEVVPGSKPYEAQLLSLQQGRHLLFVDDLPGNNSCFRKDIVVGTDNPHDRMLLAVAANLLNTPFVTELRTRQQLGYVVWSRQFLRQNRLSFLMLVQSANYSPAELHDRAEACVAGFPAMVEAMPDEVVMQAVEAVRASLEKGPTSAIDKAREFASLAFDHNEEWDRREKALEVLDSVSRDDVAAMVKRIFAAGATSSATVYLHARQHADASDTPDRIEDIEAWRSGEAYIYGK